MIKEKNFSEEELSSVCGGKVEKGFFFDNDDIFKAFGVYTDDGVGPLAVFENEDDAKKFDRAYKAGEVPQAVLDLDDARDVGKKFLGK